MTLKDRIKYRLRLRKGSKKYGLTKKQLKCFDNAVISEFKRIHGLEEDDTKGKNK